MDALGGQETTGGPSIPAGDAADEPSVARNTALAAASQLVSAALTAFLVLYLTRALGPHGYGTFALAVGVGAVLLLPADLGISASAARFIAEHRRHPRTAAEFLSSAVTLKLAVSTVLSCLLFALAGPVARAYGHPDLLWPLRGIAVVLFGQSMMTIYSTALVAVGRLGANLGAYTSESLAETAASVALVILSGGATAAAFGRAIGYAIGALAAAALTGRAFGRRAVWPHRPGRAQLTRLSRYAGLLFVVDSGWTMFTQLDVLLIGAYAGAPQVAFFALPIRLYTLLHYPGLSLTSSISPRLAAGSRGQADVGAFRVGLRYLIVLEMGALAFILVWADPIIRLLVGPGYGPAAAVLRVSAPLVLLQGVGSLASVSVNYLGQARRRIRILIGAVGINLVLDVILIPRMGALGAAIGNAAGYAVYVPAHLAICLSVLSIPLRPLLVTLARTVLAAGLATLPLLLAGTSHLTLAGWVAGTIVSCAVYLGALLALRELHADDLRRMRRALAELVSRRRLRRDRRVSV